jgi:hypothetical protein
MNRVRVLTVLATVAVVLAGSQWGFAESITLISSGGGVYDYGLTLGPGESVDFAQNVTITLSDLSRVTGASVSGPELSHCFTVSSFTPSSVVYAAPFGCASAGGDIGSTQGTLVVDFFGTDARGH